MSNISPDEKQIDPVVEAVARAVYTGTKKHYFDNLPPSVKDLAFARAAAIISAYTAALKEQGPLAPMLAEFPAEWRGHGMITWPGYDNGVLIDAYRVDLHHELSSGGGPKVRGFGATLQEAMIQAQEDTSQ